MRFAYCQHLVKTVWTYTGTLPQLNRRTLSSDVRDSTALKPSKSLRLCCLEPCGRAGVQDRHSSLCGPLYEGLLLSALSLPPEVMKSGEEGWRRGLKIQPLVQRRPHSWFRPILCEMLVLVSGRLANCSMSSARHDSGGKPICPCQRHPRKSEVLMPLGVRSMLHSSPSLLQC